MCRVLLTHEVMCRWVKSSLDFFFHLILSKLSHSTNNFLFDLIVISQRRNSKKIRKDSSISLANSQDNCLPINCDVKFNAQSIAWWEYCRKCIYIYIYILQKDIYIFKILLKTIFFKNFYIFEKISKFD